VVDRLVHIIAICPQIAPQAFHLAVQHIQQLRDPTLYKTVLSVYEQLSYTGVDLPPPSHVATLDPQWAAEIQTKNQAERLKLEIELKTYLNNMIKESIRVRPVNMLLFSAS
jgi:COP9 signalosome complex subunit 1